MSFVCLFAEANAAKIEVAHVATLTAATETAPDYPRGKFRRFFRTRDY